MEKKNPRSILEEIGNRKKEELRKHPNNNTMKNICKTMWRQGKESK